MSALDFAFEWIDPGGAKGPELRATWARFELSVDGQHVTTVVDHSSKSVRPYVFVPLYPIAEWFITRWWFLLHEVEHHESTDAGAFSTRHALRSAGEGFALPAVSFEPTGSRVRIEWCPLHAQHQLVEFTEQGIAYVDVQAFRGAVLAFVRTVVARLTELDITGTLLQEEFEALAETTKEEEEFCVAAAALGLDPLALTDFQTTEIVKVANALPESVVSEFFTSAHFSRLSEQAAAVQGAIAVSRQNTANLAALKMLKSSLSIELPQAQPWAQGYYVAEDLRKRLGLNGTRLNSVAALGTALGSDAGEFRKSVRRELANGGSLNAVVDVNDVKSPGFTVADFGRRAEVFTLCRALFEYLVSPVDQPSIVTRSRSERQKRNRAFAAEFLVPATALRSLLPADGLTYEDIDSIAEEFGVSSFVVQHQIENHKLARVPTNSW